VQSATDGGEIVVAEAVGEKPFEISIPARIDGRRVVEELESLVTGEAGAGIRAAKREGSDFLREHVRLR
jgi:hypothetical protein